MIIYIIEKNYEKYKYLEIYFKDLANVKLINEDFESFIKNNKVQCVVSPANSFGLMDGGFDYVLTKWYGNQLQERVQKYIIDNYYGEQPVGTSFIINTNKDNQYLIHTPTMRTPEIIKDEKVVYQCMRTTLIEAKRNNIESILIPMFGGSAGGVKPQLIAKLMRLAYDQLQELPTEITLKYADKLRLEL